MCSKDGSRHELVWEDRQFTYSGDQIYSKLLHIKEVFIQKEHIYLLTMCKATL